MIEKTTSSWSPMPSTNPAMNLSGIFLVDSEKTGQAASNISPSALPIDQLNITSGNFSVSVFLFSFSNLFSFSDSDCTIENAVSGTIELDASLQTLYDMDESSSSIVLDDTGFSQLVGEVQALADVTPADYNHDEDAEVINLE